MDCRVFKRADRSSWVAGDGHRQVRFGRAWVAICGDCGEEIRPSSYNANGGRWHRKGVTRKVAKDALHQHLAARHR